jgi:hypothetical protein
MITKILSIILVAVVLWLVFFLFATSPTFLYRNWATYNERLYLANKVFSLGNLPTVIVDAPPVQSPCGSDALKISDDFIEDLDCKLICKDERYGAKFIRKNQDFYYNNKLLSPGQYCLPTTASRCNASTTIVVYTALGWRCFPKFIEFGGPGGNTLTTCNNSDSGIGVIKDNLLDIVFEGEIPANLILNSPNELLPGGGFRFTCPVQYDKYNNSLVDNPFYRLFPIRNACIDGIEFASEKNKPDFSAGTCDCQDPLNNIGTFCAACREGFNIYDGNSDWRGASIGVASECLNYERPYNRYVDLTLPPCNIKNRPCIEQFYPIQVPGIVFPPFLRFGI